MVDLCGHDSQKTFRLSPDSPGFPCPRIPLSPDSPVPGFPGFPKVEVLTLTANQQVTGGYPGKRGQTHFREKISGNRPIIRLPRRSRVIVPGIAHHITQRGNDRQDRFHTPEDRPLYIDLLGRYDERQGVPFGDGGNGE
jgi:hypothetical protein